MRRCALKTGMTLIVASILLLTTLFSGLALAAGPTSSSWKYVGSAKGCSTIRTVAKTAFATSEVVANSYLPAGRTGAQAVLSIGGSRIGESYYQYNNSALNSGQSITAAYSSGVAAGVSTSCFSYGNRYYNDGQSGSYYSLYQSGTLNL